MAAKRIIQIWNAISSVDTVVGIAGWSIWKGFMAVLGGVLGAAASAFSAVPIWGWFVLILGGIALSLFIANEWASRR